MEEKFELIKHIYKDAEMASYTIEKLLIELKEKDNKIKSISTNILKEYQQFLIKSKKILEDNYISLPENGIITKVGAKIGIKKEVFHDNSDSSIADMLIKGISMGSIDMEKEISSYKKFTDNGIFNLANDFLIFQKNAINMLKKYL